MEDLQKNTVWGVEFGGSAVRIVRVRPAGSGYRADSFAEASLANRWGSVPDLAAAAGALGADQQRGRISACLSDELILYGSLTLPAAEPEVMGKMVQGQVEVLVPTQSDRFVSGWQDFPDPMAPTLQRVLICAAKREAIAGPAEGCRRLGRQAEAMAPSMVALAELWQLIDGGDADSALLLDVSARCTTLAYVKQGRIVQCGVVDVGGDTWTEQLAEHFGISCEQAETKKLAYAAGDMPDESVAAVLADSLTDWSLQLREVLEYCLTGVDRSDRPKQCILFGQSGGLPGLPSVVTSALELEARQVCPSESISLGKGVDFTRSAAAIGAALCVMRTDAPAINLLPDTGRIKLGRRAPAWRWAAAAAWLLGAVFALYGLDLGEASRLADMQRSVAERIDQKLLGRQLAVGNYLETHGPSPMAALDWLSQAMPKGALLTSLRYSRGRRRTDAKVNLTITGAVANEKECSEMLKELSKAGHPELKSGRPDKDKFRFTIYVKLGQSVEAPDAEDKDADSAEPEPKEPAKQEAPERAKPLDKTPGPPAAAAQPGGAE